MYLRRVGVLTAVFLAALGGVVVQLFRLQIVQGALHEARAREGRVWDDITATPRGRILDAEGRILACDQPDYGLALVARELPLLGLAVRDLREMRHGLSPEELPRARKGLLDDLAEREAVVAALAELTGEPRRRVAAGMLSALERVARYGGERHPEPFLFGMDERAWERLDVLLAPPARQRGGAAGGGNVLFPGLRCVWRAKRAYPAGAVACHVVGHVGEYGRDAVESLRAWGRHAADGPARLAHIRRAARRPEAREALARALGAEALERILSGSGPPDPNDPGGPGTPIPAAVLAGELSSLLRADGAAGSLSGALGPDWGPIREWLSGPDLVELAEGERVWISSRGHLDDRRVGRAGVERARNQTLRGLHGYRVMIKNLAFEEGRALPELDYLRSERPRPGEDVALEIDLRFQRTVEEVLDRTGLQGAAVFVDPRTGAVKALASRPGFDPNVYVSRSRGALTELFTDPRKPLLSRATQGLYPPGSVFKAFVAAAALEEGVIDERSRIECRHEHYVGRRRLRCLADPGHGAIDVEHALAASCNIFFYKTAERLGAPALLGWARRFGFGSVAGIDIPGEAKGMFPYAADPATASPQTMALVGIGQGPVAATPLQVAQGYAAIAANGPVPRPRVVRLTPGEEPQAGGFVPLSAGTREALVGGLVAVCHDERGTAFRAFNDPFAPGERSFAGTFPTVKVAAKTATAEHGGGEPHAWLAGFAPAHAPEIAFAVILEQGGHGGDTAAPAAARMLAAYFRMTTPQRVAPAVDYAAPASAPAPAPAPVKEE
ncbi:MAG: peptidoglycan D,D-transpeptidase FtsI family protein [Planctomycetota bacterium]